MTYREYIGLHRPVSLSSANVEDMLDDPVSSVFFRDKQTTYLWFIANRRPMEKIPLMII